MGRTRVKICGITTLEAAKACADEGADAVGFVFVARSPRAIKPEAAAEIMASLPPFIATVALLQNPTLDQFMDIEEICPTTHTQLHGNEPVQLVRECAPVIKAIRFDERTIDADLRAWEAVDEVEAILVDGSWGGEGERFDWSKLVGPASHATKPIILAGGLGPHNVAEAIRMVRPFAVDVSSGVESGRGIKDAKLIAAFCSAVREADSRG